MQVRTLPVSFMYEIHPIGMQQVDWRTFIKVCQDTLGESPTRGLDEAGMDPKDPASFVAVLGFDHKPLETLRTAIDSAHLLGHYHMSCVAVGDEDMVDALYRYSNLAVAEKRKGAKRLVVVSGTVATWFDALRMGCREDREADYRVMLNTVYDLFCSTGFREVFWNLNKIMLSDGSFRLELK